ncbi:hypothetical protein FRC07_008085 [Ceratobasidium sp. 392]|nr:hypothetical protein FRC07_008085 [Ceratobasidium sp. 392]
MSGLHKDQVLPERKIYTLELIGDPNSGGPIIVQARYIPEYESKVNEAAPNDLQFNLSSMIGNDNGSFVWGRVGFEKSGHKFRLEQDQKTEAFILRGKLLNMEGNFCSHEINLDERLALKEYVDQGSNETYSRLTERTVTPPELVELLKKNDPARQMVYYQTGVGTYGPPGLMTDIGTKIAEQADKAGAWYLYQHVIDGYKFLMQSYRIGDSISIFGFSRGAFTARALAGMLHCVGLLPKHNMEHVNFAYKVYEKSEDYNVVYKTPKDFHERKHNPDPSGFKGNISRPEDIDPQEFKQAFCIDVNIDFVGVWTATGINRDTVASVGALFPKSLPWIAFNPSIITFRQALALDERRGSFIPSVWDHRYTDSPVQDVREVWFRGEHSDIGGGSVTNEGKSKSDKPSYRMLCNIPLRWMIRQIIDCKTGILFDRRMVKLYRDRGILEIPPKDKEAVWSWGNRVKESIKLDQDDIKYPLYDSIGGLRLLWSPLEYLPVGKPSKTLNFEPDTTYWLVSFVYLS